MMAKSRRGRGEGCIQQRTNGTWYAQISLGYDSQSKRKRRTISGATKQEVREELTKLQGQADEGTVIAPSKMTVGSLLDHWLKTSIKPVVSGGTYLTYSQSIENHIKPNIGGSRIQRVTAMHLQGLLSTLTEKGLGASSQRILLAVLKAAFAQAVEWDLVTKDPSIKVKWPKLPEQEIVPLDEKQTKLFLKASKPHRIHGLFVLLVHTGLRIGEAVALRKSDIDFEGETLTVSRTIWYPGSGMAFKTPKTKSGKRTIHLSRTVIDAIYDHIKRMTKEGNGRADTLFCAVGGGILWPSHVRRIFIDILEEAELPRKRIHDLRHGHATQLLQMGVNPKLVSERLGHSSIAITLQIYGHVLNSSQQEAVQRLEKLLG